VSWEKAEYEMPHMQSHRSNFVFAFFLFRGLYINRVWPMCSFAAEPIQLLAAYAEG
jgi:hypothetical protein